MGSLEVVFYVIGIMITLTGLARGYRRELGSTLIILVAIFVLTFFQPQITELFAVVSRELFTVIGSRPELQNLAVASTFQILFALIIFASYAGRTIEFPGTPARPPLGPLLDLAVGALNGYLVAGTLWYFMHTFNYPLQSLGLIQLPLTPRGQQIIQYLPQNLLDTPAYWMLPVAILMILWVRG
jgi:uncharacterized membrane protein required for colicin V production